MRAPADARSAPSRLLDSCAVVRSPIEAAVRRFPAPPSPGPPSSRSTTCSLAGSRLHLTRYFGVLSSAARWRKQIVPKPSDSSAIPRLKRSGRWLDWASLLRRVFLAEMLACACGGTRRVIAQIEAGPTARKILRHLGLPDAGPELAPARLDQADVWATGPPAQPDCDPPWTDDVQRSPPDFAA